MIVLRAAACGAAAQGILAAGEPGSVIGLTSRGIFCATASGRVVFVSFEAWRGPLTINLATSEPSGGDELPQRPAFQKGQPPFERVELNSPVIFAPGEVRFVAGDVRVQTSHLPGWEAAWSPPGKWSMPEIQARYRQVAGQVMLESAGRGWSRLLARWTGEPVAEAMPGELEPVARDLEQLAGAARRGDPDAMVSQACRLLGRGTGLTPSGDDVITGFLLALARKQDPKGFGKPLGSGLLARETRDPKGFGKPLGSGSLIDLSLRIVEEARQKTTWLAAGLIECAAGGQADERLVTALDGALAGSLPPEECARRLLAYGSSSGADVWIGVGLALHLSG